MRSVQCVRNMGYLRAGVRDIRQSFAYELSNLDVASYGFGLRGEACGL